MAWEQRRGGLYYYRPVRIDGKPRRRYLGRGAVALAHDLADRERRQQRQAEQSLLTRLILEAAEQDAAWAEIVARGRILATAKLLACGWYRHYGSWRRRRKRMDAPPNPSSGPPPKPEPNYEGLRKTIERLIDGANRGDSKMIARLHRYLDKNSQFCAALGDLTGLATDRFARTIATDPIHAEAIRRQAAAWIDEIAGPYADPIVRALAEAASVARLAMTHAQTEAAAAASDPPAVAAVKLKRLDTTTRRFVATLRTLGQVQQATPTPVVPKPKVYTPPGERTGTA